MERHEELTCERVRIDAHTEFVVAADIAPTILGTLGRARERFPRAPPHTPVPEIPELIRVAAPVYVKFGLRNAPELYPSGSHVEATAVSLSRGSDRRARLGLERPARSGYEPTASEFGAACLALPLAQIVRDVGSGCAAWTNLRLVFARIRLIPGSPSDSQESCSYGTGTAANSVIRRRRPAIVGSHFSLIVP